MAHPHRPHLSRRRFLATTGGAATGAVLLGDLHATGLTTRVVFGLADAEGLLPYDDTPEELEVTLIAPDGRRSAQPITVRRHGETLPRAYFALEVRLDDPGIYTVRVDLGGPAASEMAFQVKDASEITVVKPGDAMPAAVTPTAAATRDVTPICTAEPACPYHDVTLAAALDEGRPIALLVSTPKFCTSSACGPVHGVFVGEMGNHPDVRALHAEVYLHPEINRTDYAPILGELRMVSEPTLFLVGSDGVVQTRLDSIYDADELREKLTTLT